MSERGEELNAEHLRELFQEISDRLAARDQEAQLFVVGGAAMALEYDGGRLTRDVDAAFVPTSAVRQIAAEISEVHGLEPDWINDAAKGFMPGADESPRTVFESESLLVQVPSPEYLLAMKLHSSRDERDLADAATLFNIAGYTTADEAVDLLEKTYRQTQLLPRHRYVAEDVAGRAAVQRASTPSASTSSTSLAALMKASFPKSATEATRRGTETRSPQRPPQRPGPSNDLGRD